MSYAGDLTPQQAWDLLQKNPGATLVDVRTEGEWRTIGVPDTSAVGHQPRFVEWNTAHGPNPDFLPELRAADPDTDAPVLFLCRSGVRSVAAAQAATAAGYSQAFNILEGFEGAQDASGARTVDGWRNDGLPTAVYGVGAK